MSKWVAGFALGALLLSQVAVGWASWSGFGIQSLGPNQPSIRVGSLFGPRVGDGGPGSGK
jgi:hypothetical protein